MLKVLEGIAQPMFDPVENKRVLEAAHEKISESCDRNEEKDTLGKYRKSDLALLDKNALGPVYLKILTARRKKQ